MNQSVKRINRQSQQRNQPKKLTGKNNSKKFINGHIQNPFVQVNICLKNKKLNSYNQSKQFNFLNSKFTSINTKENVQNLNLKLNRVKSEYIRPISSNSLPKTPITTAMKKSQFKVNVDPKKLIKQKKKEYLISQDCCNINLSQQMLSNINSKNFTEKRQIINKEVLLSKKKKELKTNNLSKTKEQKSLSGINKLNNQKVKLIKNLSRNLKNQSKSELKKTNKKKFNLIKINDHIKTPLNKKNPSSSTCSIKNYYVKQKNNTQQKNLDKKQLIHSTSRGTTKNTIINQSFGSRKLSTTTLMRNFNSSTEFNDFHQKSQIENQLLQRIQRTLQCYQISLQSEVSKRKSLQIENSILKQELVKVMKKNNN